MTATTKIARFLRPLGSVGLALISLGLMMVLVFWGTLAQVHIGTFAAQKEYFSRFFVYGEPFGFRMPVLPGGFLVGGLWLVNLVAAFVFQFRFVKKRAGLLVSHFGLILLLVGQFLTQILSHESQMAIEEGQSSNFSENLRDMELAFINASHPDYDEVTSVPQSVLKHEGLIEAAALPFKVRVKKFFPNADLKMDAAGTPLATQGVGTHVLVEPLPPITTDDQPNTVTIYAEILEGEKSLGTWLVSAGLAAPQSVKVNGVDYSFSIRPHRTYYPFTLRLKDFTHDIYPGTDIPKNFSSLVHLSDPEKNESRDVLIYMNNPLRYEGKTFYQASFGKNDTLSILQVVRNPAWVTPYLSCSLVVLGLAIHFMMSLIGFVKRRP